MPLPTTFTLIYTSIQVEYKNINCFDLGEHTYTLPCYNKLKETFGERININIGDSTQTLINHHKLYDLIHIDGGHSTEVANSDIIHSYRLSKQGTILIMDDYDFPNLHTLWDTCITKYNLKKLHINLYNSPHHDIKYHSKVNSKVKIVRLGMTESGLLFLNWVYKSVKLNQEQRQMIMKHIMNLTNWLYTTSGYYDKSVKGDKFNFDQSSLNVNYYNFIGHLETAVKNCTETRFYFHDGMIMNLYNQLKEPFKKHHQISNLVLMNNTKSIANVAPTFDKMRNKKVLVISSFTDLVKQQYESGNVFKLGIDFPQITSLDGVTTPYCFLNDGPHNNYFETLDHMFNEIKIKDFDIAILGCGSYGHMLTHKIHSELNKDAIYIGGPVTNLFGILSSRELKHGMGKDVKLNEYWITSIPESFRPKNYKNIEDGCYW